MKTIIFLFLLIFSKVACAEIYKDFTPFISLKEVKQNYPNAKIEDLKAAWVKSGDYFMSLTGVGITGSIYLKMSDRDLIYKSYLAKIDSEYSDKDSSEYKNKTNLYVNYLNKSLDERITLDWVRWIPAQNIPFERIEARYGKPDSCGYDEESFSPFCSWNDMGLVVYQSDNKKQVLYIQYMVTAQDLRKHLGLEPKPESQKVNPKPKSKDKK